MSGVADEIEWRQARSEDGASLILLMQRVLEARVQEGSRPQRFREAGHVRAEVDFFAQRLRISVDSEPDRMLLGLLDGSAVAMAWYQVPPGNPRRVVVEDLEVDPLWWGDSLRGDALRRVAEDVKHFGVHVVQLALPTDSRPLESVEHDFGVGSPGSPCLSDGRRIYVALDSEGLDEALGLL